MAGLPLGKRQGPVGSHRTGSGHKARESDPILATVGSTGGQVGDLIATEDTGPGKSGKRALHWPQFLLLSQERQHPRPLRSLRVL